MGKVLEMVKQVLDDVTLGDDVGNGVVIHIKHGYAMNMMMSILHVQEALHMTSRWCTCHASTTLYYHNNKAISSCV